MLYRVGLLLRMCMLHVMMFMVMHVQHVFVTLYLQQDLLGIHMLGNDVHRWLTKLLRMKIKPILATVRMTHKSNMTKESPAVRTV